MTDVRRPTDPTTTDAWARGVARARAAMAQGEADREAYGGRHGQPDTITLSTDGGPASFYQRQWFKLCLGCGWGTDHCTCAT